jgi:uncharacterized protein (DUF1499 family)
MATPRGTTSGMQAAKISAFVRFGLLLAIVAVAGAILAPLGNRLGWWNYKVAFTILRWSAYTGVAAAVISLVGAILARPGGGRRGFGWSLLGIVIGLAVFSGPLLLLNKAKQVPPIHDITTDTTNPPQFVAALPLRANAENPATYGGPEIAAQQLKAYPQIVPLNLPVSPDKAFERSLATVRDSGWQLVAAAPAEGRIEATATTLVYGFKDDVVIRISPAAQGSRVDVRSVSRVGRSDLGANAARIDSFLNKLADAK